MINKRKQIRLENYDYSRSGLYFVTICTQNRECLFGKIVVGATRGSPVFSTRGSPAHMELNGTGKIIENIWKSLSDHHPVKLDAFQIMPNHVHFIIQIIDAGGSRPAPTTLGTIIGLFKSECTKQIRIGSSKIHVWQRNYYEHIIHTENDLNKIRQYIKNNPLFWNWDINY